MRELGDFFTGPNERAEFVPNLRTVAIQVETSSPVLLHGGALNVVLMPLRIVTQNDPTSLSDDRKPHIIRSVVFEFNRSLRIVEILDTKWRVRLP